MVSFQDTEWKVFPRFLPPMRSTLLLGKDDSRSCVEIRNAKAGNEATLKRQPGSVRSSSLGEKLDPALKSWMDNVIVPAGDPVEARKELVKHVSEIRLSPQAGGEDGNGKSHDVAEGTWRLAGSEEEAGNGMSAQIRSVAGPLRVYRDSSQKCGAVRPAGEV